jgi:hypothetical protein
MPADLNLLEDLMVIIVTDTMTGSLSSINPRMPGQLRLPPWLRQDALSNAMTT